MLSWRDEDGYVDRNGTFQDERTVLVEVSGGLTDRDHVGPAVSFGNQCEMKFGRGLVGKPCAYQGTAEVTHQKGRTGGLARGQCAGWSGWGCGTHCGSLGIAQL